MTKNQTKKSTPGKPKTCGKCKKPKTKCKCGRPPVITNEVLRKLEKAFSIGCSDREAVVYAGIGLQTLYDYQKKNPEFSEQKKNLKEKIPLKARMELAKGLKGNPELALKVLERLKKDEFGLKRFYSGELLTGEMTPERAAKVNKILGSDNEELFDQDDDEYSDDDN